MRRAALDVGTNTVLLTIVEIDANGLFQILDECATVTRLGFQVDQNKRLDEAAVARTLRCFEECKRRLDKFQVTELRAVGTSALRDAAGGDAFLRRAEEILGDPLEVIDGAREAELTFIGSMHGLNVEGPVFVFDIGGGSTELILGHADSKHIDFATSLNLGSVRLTERFKLSDPATAAELSSLRRLIKQTLSELSIVVAKGTDVIGVAGTVTTLCALVEGLRIDNPGALHGKKLSAENVSSLVESLARLTVNERLKLPGMTQGRADVIVAGGMLCEELLRLSHATELTVSDRGVRFGLLAEAKRR